MSYCLDLLCLNLTNDITALLPSIHSFTEHILTNMKSLIIKLDKLDQWWSVGHIIIQLRGLAHYILRLCYEQLAAICIIIN